LNQSKIYWRRRVYNTPGGAPHVRFKTFPASPMKIIFTLNSTRLATCNRHTFLEELEGGTGKRKGGQREEE